MGRGSAMWPRGPVSHLGHEEVPTLPCSGCGKPNAWLWRQERMTVASSPLLP